jgi:AcrR family transcriptional regulator
MSDMTVQSVPGVTGIDGADGADGADRAVAAAHDRDRRAPGRPRSAVLDEAIAEAVLDLLAEGVTVEAMSMEAVAARAGVGKATIYRRWPNKEAMLIEAVARLKGDLPKIKGESVREDLLTLMRPIGRVKITRQGQIMPCLIPHLHRSPELHRLYQRMLEPRRELMREVLRRGVATGELRADIDVEVVGAMLAAPLVAQAVLRWNPNLPGDDLPERLLDTLLAGITAAP